MSMRKLPRFLLFTTALLLPDVGAQLYIIGYPPNVECLEDDDIARRLKGEFHILIYDPIYPMRRVVLILAFIPAVVLAQAKERSEERRVGEERSGSRSSAHGAVEQT